MESDRRAVRRCGRCLAHSGPGSRRCGQEVRCDAFPERATGVRLPWLFTASARDLGRGVAPTGSWGARREERQVDCVVNVVHAIWGTLREAGADRPDDDEAVLVTEVRIEQDRGGYPTTGD